MKRTFRKSKPLLILLVSAWLIGMSFFFSACTNMPVSPPTPFGGSGNQGGTSSPSPPGSSSANYVVGAIGYQITVSGSIAVTTYTLVADVAVQQTPSANAAVTVTDPNGTTQYPLSYSGATQIVGGVTCGVYQSSPVSFSTNGTFNLKVVTTAGTSSASVTAVNSAVTFASPYTALSWTGTFQQNTLSMTTAATPTFSYNQSVATSPMNIPPSIYTSGVDYNYQFLQLNNNTTLSGGTGELGYLETTSGNFVAP